MPLVPPCEPHVVDWCAISDEALPVATAIEWATLERCGGVVSFTGTVRDHSEGRPGVVSLEYEAYEEHAVARLAAVAASTRQRWPDLGRLALLHRVGVLELSEAAVVVVASAPHRGEAFEAARFAIDTLKATVPIWKRERWQGGDDWVACDHGLVDAGDQIR